MSQGLGGWPGRDVHLESAAQCDLVFWTFQANRPHGHVGAIFSGQKGDQRVTHSSAARGVVVDRLDGPLLKTLTKVRRLTIGD